MPATRSTETGSTAPGWLALGAASRLVGVDPDTLRRWADEGRISAYATPGGHRRFAREDLERLVAARRVGPVGSLAAIGATPARIAAAYRRGYARPRGARAGAAWMAERERDGFRDEGRRLVVALLAHLDAPEPRARRRTEAEASGIAERLGAQLAAAGIPLDDAVAQFVTARRPFLAELASLARRRALPSDRLADLYDRASGLLDRLLLRFVEAHRDAVRGRIGDR